VLPGAKEGLNSLVDLWLASELKISEPAKASRCGKFRCLMASKDKKMAVLGIICAEIE